MKNYEISIVIEDENYVDDLIISLVRMGYSVYISCDKKSVCFSATDEEVIETAK